MKRYLQTFQQPIPHEKKQLLEQRWQELAPEVKLPGQGFGRQATGCGATIGAMPRCDFDCHGCYLGKDANQIPRLPLAEILSQIDQLREFLGPKGNLQITDGEVTLLPRAELIAMIRHARDVGMIPMLMTHGDTFRRQADLLPALVSEAGLTEVSIHVDSLQQGRRGEFGKASSEVELMPLRQEMADMILAVRRETGVRLRAATTMTVTQSNLPEIAEVVHWAFENREAFGLISFQPLAQVGRTREGLQGVTPDALWRSVDEALAPFGYDGSQRTPLQLGHPDCTRMEPLAVYTRRGEQPQVMPIVRAGVQADVELMESYLEQGLGGVAFRDDPPMVRVARSLGLFAKAPRWWLGPARRWLLARVANLGTSVPRMAFDLARRKVSFNSFMVVSHHFMDDAQVATPEGQERLDACVFRVPVNGEMKPMCQVNAGGLRDVVYGEAQAQAELVQLSS